VCDFHSHPLSLDDENPDRVRRVGDSVIPGLSSTHYEYLVTTAGEAPWRRVEVRRRFKDFVVSGRETEGLELFWGAWGQAGGGRRAGGCEVHGGRQWWVDGSGTAAV